MVIPSQHGNRVSAMSPHPPDGSPALIPPSDPPSTNVQYRIRPSVQHVPSLHRSNIRMHLASIFAHITALASPLLRPRLASPRRTVRSAPAAANNRRGLLRHSRTQSPSYIAAAHPWASRCYEALGARLLGLPASITLSSTTSALLPLRSMSAAIRASRARSSSSSATAAAAAPSRPKRSPSAGGR